MKQKNTLAATALAWFTPIILATGSLACEDLPENCLDNGGRQLSVFLAPKEIIETDKIKSIEYNTSGSLIQPNLTREKGYPASFFPLFVEIIRHQEYQTSGENSFKYLRGYSDCIRVEQVPEDNKLCNATLRTIRGEVPHSLPTEKGFIANHILEYGHLQELQQRTEVTVVIDVFRAFTTASYVLEQRPAKYMLTTKSTVISRLASELSTPLLIGKPEIGAILHYNIPNSPTRVKEVQVTGQNVLHRTEGGAKGVLDVKGANLILVAGLANADATAQYIKKLINPKVKIVPMGHEATTPSLEDDICAQYIKACLKNQTVDLASYREVLRKGSGKYFFSDDQWQYPQEDFDSCLELGRFNFAIQATIENDYAILTRCEESF